MEINNTIKTGIHLDNSVYEQPQGSMRNNVNGVITDIGNGNYKWSNIKGNLLSFSLPNDYLYFTHCLIRNRLIVITLNAAETIVSFIEVTISNNIGSLTTLHTGNNTEFNFSFDYPIRAIWGFYENEDVQRIYLTDFNNQPRVINIGGGSTFEIVEKFTRFTPVIDGLYGTFMYLGQTSNGTIKAGTIFFAWRFYTLSGYYTDWSYLSNPVQVSDGVVGFLRDTYQQYEGSAPDSNTGKSIQLSISNIDIDYDAIEIAAFYSNDLNISLPGVIFYNSPITSSTVSATYYGSENLGSVTIDDLIETSIVIEKCKDMLYAKKKNIIANTVEREELSTEPISGSEYYIEADISIEDYDIVVDTSGYPGKKASSGAENSLTSIWNSTIDCGFHFLRRGQWYRAITQTVYTDGAFTITVPAGNVFKVSNVYTTTLTYVSGSYEAVIVIKKYLKYGHFAYEDINVAYEFDVFPLSNEYPDYKSSKVANHLKGYPMGEKVRLGIVFFDHTGRPFFARHLRNTNVTYGPGDVNMPMRGDDNMLLKCHGANTGHVPGGGFGASEWFNQANALTKSLIVNYLDITDIRDQISGFMIVRAPIVHQYLGMGILVPTYESGDDVYSYPGLRQLGGTSHNFAGCYSLYCPEDLLNAKDFSIQSGDELENIMWLQPYDWYENETISGDNFPYFGKQESNDVDLYQKLYLKTSFNNVTHPSNPNGHPYVSHEILNVTKYTKGDVDLVINPSDPTKKYKDSCRAYLSGINIHIGLNGNHSVVILDIDEGTDGDGNNWDIKGWGDNNSATWHDPYAAALLVAVKRPNTDPYGGYSDSSLSNTTYIAVGHYQEINDAVLADIYDAGTDTYVFNGIQIFGGDTFINLFDYKRLYIDSDAGTDKLGHGMIFPVESRMNIALREGNHLAKTRSYDSLYKMDGLRSIVSNPVIEEFNYNDGYSTDNISDYYLPVPYDYQFRNIFDARLRYSLEKNYGENQDMFLRFLPNDYIDVNTNNGPITNVRHKHERIIYWQPDEVGYIPIYERTLTQNSVGQPVQLGIGGLFERYDQLIDRVGNSQQFGLVESINGFHWYDAKRKIFISIGEDLKIDFDSIVKGMDSFFVNNIPDEFWNYDTPSIDYGCFGAYDIISKMVFYTFNTQDDEFYTIGIHAVLNCFVGFYNKYPSKSFTYIGRMYDVSKNLTDIYIHGLGDYHRFFDVDYDSSLTLIIKENTNEVKIFDTFEMIGNENFFTNIRLENSSQDINEDVASYDTGSLVILNRNYKYLKRRWFGNFQRDDRERMSDGYMKITLTMNAPYLVELYELKTDVRKMM